MKWLIKKLGGAVIAGVGWKIGTDVYEFIKERVFGEEDAPDGAAEEGAAEQTAEATPEGDGDGGDPAPARGER